VLALGILYKFLFFISFCFQALPCELPAVVRIAKECSGTGDNGCGSIGVRCWSYNAPGVMWGQSAVRLVFGELCGVELCAL